jgi:hypothetical protein
MGQTGHVTFMGKMRQTYFLLGNNEERNHLEDLGSEGKITLKKLDKRM